MKPTHLLTLVAIVALCLPPLLGISALAQGPADEAASVQAPEERVLREAMDALGWPDTLTKKPLYQMESDDDTMFMLWPPESAARYFLKRKFSATNGGSYEEETIQYARILALGEDGGRVYIDKMVENGFTHSSYQGREGVVVRPGDELCNAGGLVGALSKWINEWIRKLYESLDAADSFEEQCPTAAAGYIAWTCGSHTFVARDDTGQGGEEAIAAALFHAAERNGLCDLGDTLVILAGTDDVPGAKPIATYQKMGQDLNAYYGQNAYGKVSLAYTYMDADGNAGDQDWYKVGPTMAGYAGQQRQFAQDAIRKAYEGGAPREELNFARIIVVYAGKSQQDAPGVGQFQTWDEWPANAQWHEITVGPAASPSKVFAGSIVMVAEDDPMGAWAHEVGHSLYSKNVLFGKYYYVSDRYNYTEPYGQYGNIGYWGLMGLGVWWGDPKGTAPTHMSSFSKESAEWLSYTDAKLGEQYTLTALERQKAGGTVLRVDDPLSANPNRFLILEARDATAPYGAPESGVVVYYVSWDGANNHHVVNTYAPDTAPATATGAGGRTYTKPGLNAGSKVWEWPDARLRLTLHSESAGQGYSAVVSANVYTPTALVGAVAAPEAVPAPGAPPTVTVNFDGPKPDLDLHAYDTQGRHVGLNYQTGEYEAQIPGAVYSGDLLGAPEWIYVPEGTQVRFEMSAEKTAQYLAANPQFKAEAKPQKYDTTYVHFDAQGVETWAKGSPGELAAGAQSALTSPTDPALDYKPAPVPHFGRNWPTLNPFNAVALAILAMGLVGWIVALARR